jgi:hypothetical protein
MRFASISALFALTTLLAACGPQSPEEVRAASIAKCERQFGRMAPDPSKGNALCSCMTDRLAEQGLEITDMLGAGREQVESITRNCAARAGIALPNG